MSNNPTFMRGSTWNVFKESKPSESGLYYAMTKHTDKDLPVVARYDKESDSWTTHFNFSSIDVLYWKTITH